MSDSIAIDWVKIHPDKSLPTLLTEVDVRGNSVMAMKGLKYRVFTMLGNKLRNVQFQLSVRLQGQLGQSQMHDLNCDPFRIGRDVETHFYDRDIGEISSITLFVDGKALGAGKSIAVLN